MADLEQRVGVLETRADQLVVDTAHATDLGATATRQAVAAQQAHKRNIELLNALRETQAEHSQMHAEHSRRFDVIDRRLEVIDGRLESIDGRMNAIDGTLGRVTLGMHTIEGLLRGLTDDG
ncbi:hypothetical protein BH23ACT10_BH23ACT10_24150 [soil metagenome]